MITLELPYDPGADARPDELPDDHLEMVRELWRHDSARLSAGRSSPALMQAMLATAIRFPAHLLIA